MMNFDSSGLRSADALSAAFATPSAALIATATAIRCMICHPVQKHDETRSCDSRARKTLRAYMRRSCPSYVLHSIVGARTIRRTFTSFLERAVIKLTSLISLGALAAFSFGSVVAQPAPAVVEKSQTISATVEKIDAK